MTTKLDAGWCCADCAMLLAKGETPPEWAEDTTAAWLAEIDRRNHGLVVVLGGEHKADCTNDGSHDCDCEHEEFSWRSCDVCGSGLGGAREAVTWFED